MEMMVRLQTEMAARAGSEAAPVREPKAIGTQVTSPTVSQ